MVNDNEWLVEMISRDNDVWTIRFRAHDCVSIVSLALIITSFFDVH